MIRNLIVGLGAIFGILVVVVLFRTFNYGADPVGGRVELPEPPAISAERGAQNLAQAIRFRTVTVAPGDPRPGQEEPWIALHQWLEQTYPAAHAAMQKELVPGTLTLLYTWEGSDPGLNPILLMAHQDVVPVNIGTEGDWTGAPFDGDIVDGFIYGRGTIDDKGSLVALMEAAEALATSGFQPKRTILFMFGHDEEVSGSGAQAGIALLKSRGIEPEMALDEGFMIVDPSPLSGKAMGFIGIAEKGYVTLEITATGEGGHSSTPPRDSAAVRLARAVVALDENQMKADFTKPPVSDLFRSAARDMSFVQRMAFANLWLFEGMIEKQMSAIPSANAMIRTTTAPTMLAGSAKENVLAQRAVAVVNFRIHPNNTEEEIIEHVREVTASIPGIEIAVGQQGIRGQGASPVSPTDNLAYAVLASVAEATAGGAPAAPGLVLGATDARYASDITPNVYRFAPSIMSPEDLTGFHGTNERLAVENMGRLARGYSQIILAMDKGA
ncbi:M20 family peptidase [Hyphomonas sp. WL0036]|uniref:M20 family peptidase n=1 Tax=Hyphomonas sediminis TaxID=2866160 RepID=UPI001C7E66B3|nr:M20 family peptidase [Hyphomonas sediminis]MBY9065427.1 M20 family peptidase [Hyphomonas sediminis]